MIKTTQADVLNKIVPQKDKSRGVYTASVPSQEFFLTCTIPLFRLAQKPLKILLTIFKLRHEACSH